MNYKDICLNVCEIAKQVGAFIKSERENFSVGMIEIKGHQNFVSHVDKQAEIMCVGLLRKLLPEAGYITEEQTTEQTKAQLMWVIDPLDGTTNFIHGLPPYCVSIALMDGDEVVVGVIYEVHGSECFYAWKDSKAYMNGREIRASECNKMCDALVSMGFAYDMDDTITDFLRQTEYVQLHTHGVRRLGSAAANLAYLACGRFDAFSQINLSPWDVAAGVLIVKAAGGAVTDFKGGENYVFGREVITTNKALYDEFKKIVTG